MSFYTLPKRIVKICNGNIERRWEYRENQMHYFLIYSKNLIKKIYLNVEINIRYRTLSLSLSWRY